MQTSMAQLMPLPLTVSKIQIGFTFLVPADLGSPGKRAVKRECVCVKTRKSYLRSISSGLPLPSSHPVPEPRIRSHDFWRCINLCACM